MTLKKRTASFLTACGLLAGSLVGLSATNASAADVCNVTTVIQNNSSGYGYFQGDTPVRPKPYAECGSQGTFASGTKFYFWCSITNDYGNNWVFGRIAGTETKGWVYWGNVSWVSGTLNTCF